MDFIEYYTFDDGSVVRQFCNWWSPLVYAHPNLTLPSDTVTSLCFWLGAEGDTP